MKIPRPHKKADESTKADASAKASEEARENEAAQMFSKKELKKLRKRQKKDRKREIKHILLGSYRATEDGRLISGGESLIPRNGFSEGAASILILGIADKRYQYISDNKNPTQAKSSALKAMKNIGRELVISYAPDAKACYIRGLFFRSVVLVFDEVTDADGTKGLELHAYCGRSLTTFFSIRRAVSKFDKNLPSTVHRI